MKINRAWGTFEGMTPPRIWTREADDEDAEWHLRGDDGKSARCGATIPDVPSMVHSANWTPPADDFICTTCVPPGVDCPNCGTRVKMSPGDAVNGILEALEKNKDGAYMTGYHEALHYWGPKIVLAVGGAFFALGFGLAIAAGL